ncbi:LysR family transcriptional regulator substrate-binding protein [Frigoribacterium salinisoli]
MSATTFRVGAVPGVTLSKWSRAWAERRADLPLEVVEVDPEDPLTPVRDGSVDMVLARLPLSTDGFSAIPLYEERPVVVVAKDHLLAALAPDEEVALADLAAEHRHDLELAPADAVAVVATGPGVAVLPQSLARMHAQKGTTYRFVADLPGTTIALLWPDGRDDDDTDDFVGVVRGRTARSSRGRSRDDAPDEAPARRGAGSKGTGTKGGAAAGGKGVKGGRGGAPARGSRAQGGGPRRGGTSRGRGGR